MVFRGWNACKMASAVGFIGGPSDAGEHLSRGSCHLCFLLWDMSAHVFCPFHGIDFFSSFVGSLFIFSVLIL